jgi:hypothetical protein
MNHPWTRLSPATRSRLLWPMIALCLLASAGMYWLGRPLDVTPGRSGIVDLELCWWGDRCGALIAGWPSPDAANPGLYTDYGFLILYSATIGLACLQAGPLLGGFGRLAEPLAWAQVVAALCDAVENTALLAMIGGARGPEAAIAFGCAVVKFAWVIAGLLYAGAGAVAWLRSRWS